MTSPNLDRRTVLAGLSAVPLAAVFPPPAFPQTAKEAWLDDCARRFIDRAALTRREADEIAGLCWKNTVDSEGPAPKTGGAEAADIEMSYWDEPA
jgi:hypothetical protein